MVAGGAIAYLEIRKADALAFGLAVSTSQALRVHVAQGGEPHTEPLNAALAPLLKQGYVHARVSNRLGDMLAEANSANHAALLARLAKREHVPESLVAGGHRTLWLPSELVVQVSIPLHDRNGNTIGSFSGAYQVDAAVRQRVLSDLARNVSMVLLAILLTTLVLYPVIIGLNKGVTQLSAELMGSNIALMEVLGSAIAKRDSDTDLHNYRVCLYSIRFAEALGLADQTIRVVIAGAFLHDVGKIGISDTILLKPGRLTAEEFSVMKSHVQLGIDIVTKSNWLNGARNVIEFHHERFDGSGYPHGLRGESIPMVARLFAIVDVFDALTSRRPYKQPVPLKDAVRILAESRGSHFDPRLLDVFQDMAVELHAELAGLAEAGLRQKLQQQVTKYFLESFGEGVSSLRGA